MKTLFLDLASRQGTIACVDDASTCAITSVDHRMGDDELMPALESTMRKAGWSYKDLTNIACVAGPGGFTSLRMAVTLANVLSDQLGIAAAAVHLSDLYASRFPLTPNPFPPRGARGTLVSSPCPPRGKGRGWGKSADTYIWLHSTKKTALFVRTFNIDASPWTEPTFIVLDQLQTKNQKPITCPWAGELIPEHAATIEHLGIKPASLSSPEEVLPSFLAAQTYKKELLVPWYGRGW